MLELYKNRGLNAALASGRPLFTQTSRDPQNDPDWDTAPPVEDRKDTGR